MTWKPFGELEITPEEIRAAQGVTAKVSELAILGIVASVAGTVIRTLVQQIDIDTEVIKIIFRVTQNARDSDSDSIAITLPRRLKTA